MELVEFAEGFDMVGKVVTLYWVVSREYHSRKDFVLTGMRDIVR